MHVNEANSQVMGQKLKQPSHTSSSTKENNDIKCFSLFVFFVWFSFFLWLLITISPEMSICVVPNDGKQVSFLSVELFGCQLRRLPRRLTALLISQLST